jgi:hypothetical protein
MLPMPRRKQIYKVTYPNGKIYVGMDLIGVVSYFGSPSRKTKERIAADLAEHRLDLTLRKEILWESETASDAEVRAKEIEMIRETGANDPAIGYNTSPRHRPTVAGNGSAPAVGRLAAAPSSPPEAPIGPILGPPPDQASKT